MECFRNHDGHMREISATDARNRFGQLLDAAQSTPVRITRKGRAVAVMMSAQHYAHLQGAAWDHLAATMGLGGTGRRQRPDARGPGRDPER